MRITPKTLCNHSLEGKRRTPPCPKMGLCLDPGPSPAPYAVCALTYSATAERTISDSFLPWRAARRAMLSLSC